MKPIYLYTILHSLVDACSVTVLVVGGMAWQRVLAYNALAFALQFPLGVALDARPRLVKGTFVASLALTLAGVGLCACDGAAGVRALVCLEIEHACPFSGRFWYDSWGLRVGMDLAA